jgi:hypothetical protein
VQANRQQQATTGLVVVVLAVLLGSLWAGGAAAPAAGMPGGQLTSTALLPGLEAAALPDRVPALRPSAQRPDPGGRLLPLLLGLLAVSLTVANGVPARRRRPGPAPARALVLATPQGPRAPPRLQPTGLIPAPRRTDRRGLTLEVPQWSCPASTTQGGHRGRRAHRPTRLPAGARPGRARSRARGRGRRAGRHHPAGRRGRPGPARRGRPAPAARPGRPDRGGGRRRPRRARWPAATSGSGRP